jgi:signal transduction histidine kinase
VEAPAFTALRIRIAETLRRQAGEITKRWESQSWSIALREGPDEGMVRHPHSPEVLVESLARSVASEGTSSDGMIPLGLTYGAEAFEAGASLHQMLKALDLLSAMVLYRVETTVAGEVSGDLNLADMVRLTRRLQQDASLLSRAAVKGYTQAVSSRMRATFRHIRHDLRNPLGTIKSVLALMDDETIPILERANPRLRAMARRNARLLGELIADRLSDSEVVSPVPVYQSVSLRTVACAVRRDLRAEAMARSVTILIAGTKAHVRVDAVALELMLYELLRAALQEASKEDEISIDFSDGTGDRAIVRIQSMPAHPPIADHASLERLTTLMLQMGARLETKDCLILSLPIQHLESDTTLSVLQPSDSRESHHDVRGTRQRENGQSSSF